MSIHFLVVKLEKSSLPSNSAISLASGIPGTCFNASDTPGTCFNTSGIIFPNLPGKREETRPGDPEPLFVSFSSLVFGGEELISKMRDPSILLSNSVFLFFSVSFVYDI